MRVPEEGNRWLTYRELAPKLADYVERMDSPMSSFLPVMNHPFYVPGVIRRGLLRPDGTIRSTADLIF